MYRVAAAAARPVSMEGTRTLALEVVTVAVKATVAPRVEVLMLLSPALLTAAVKAVVKAVAKAAPFVLAVRAASVRLIDVANWLVNATLAERRVFVATELIPMVESQEITPEVITQ